MKNGFAKVKSGIEEVMEGPEIRLSCWKCGEEVFKEKMLYFKKKLKEARKNNEIFEVMTFLVRKYDIIDLEEMIKNPEKINKEDLIKVLKELLEMGEQIVLCEKCYRSLFEEEEDYSVLEEYVEALEKINY